MKVQKNWKNRKGVYRIYTKDKCYIGSAVNLYDRLAVHISHLRKNKHHSVFMQRVFNKYGEESFDIEILEYCNEMSEKELRELELKYILQYNSEFNSTTPVYYKHSEEMKSKISETLTSEYKSGEIIHYNLNKGKKIDIFDIQGNLIHSNVSVNEAVEILKLSNRSVINNLLRTKKPYLFNKKWIIMKHGENYIEYLFNYIKSSDAQRLHVYKINEDNSFERVKYNYTRMYNKIIVSQNFIFSSNKNKCLYTFPGLINYAVQNRNILNNDGANTVKAEMLIPC